MGAISVNNGYRQHDESGGEVNVTNIPVEAIIGSIRIRNYDNDIPQDEVRKDQGESYIRAQIGRSTAMSISLF